MKKTIVILMVILFFLTACTSVTSEVVTRTSSVQCTLLSFHSEVANRRYYFEAFPQEDASGCLEGTDIDGAEIRFCGPVPLVCVKN